MHDFLTMKNITKEFPGVKALDDVSFSVKRGEVHVLVGENGAGKSTLVKILSGIYSVEEGGEIVIDGSKVVFKGITHANEMGIYIIHQELNLVSELSIAENINLGKPYPMKKYGLINWEIIHK